MAQKDQSEFPKSLRKYSRDWRMCLRLSEGSGGNDMPFRCKNEVFLEDSDYGLGDFLF